MVGLQGSAVVGQEESPRAGRIDRHVVQVGILQTLSRKHANVRQQALDPLRWTPVGIHRAAAFTRAIPGQQGIARGREVFHVTR